MARGELRVYLGAAAGVGKTYAMLNEGRRRREYGEDVVVGYVEPHGRRKTTDQVGDLEVVPRRQITYRGVRFEEMDVDAVLARRPAVALVDELAHTNVPGLRKEKRWQDVEELLQAGVSVITTLNIQHLESLNDVVERITSVQQRETIPDDVVRRADEIQVVDLTPLALRNRLARGDVYPAERIDAALANYFRPGNLSALRELALAWVADRVDEGLAEYRSRHGIERPWETRERVLVALTGSSDGERLIRRAGRIAQRSRGDLVGVHVSPQDGLAAPSVDLLEQQRELLEELGGAYHEVVGEDAGTALVEAARALNATQIVMGASRRSRWERLTRGSVIEQVIRQAGTGIDVHVIGYAPGAASDDALPRRRRPAALPRRRVTIGLALAVAVPPVLAWALTHFRASIGLPSVLLLFLLLVVAIAALGGLGPALLAAVTSFLLVNFYFTPPTHTFTIGDGENILALAGFLAVAVVVSSLVAMAARRTAEAARMRAEADALARLAGGSSLPAVLESFTRIFGLEGAAVLRPLDGGWQIRATSGVRAPVSPEEASRTIELDGDDLLAVAGSPLRSEDQRIFDAFTKELRAAVAFDELEEEVVAAEALSTTNELRSAILSSVSHDLRTPISAIKASATSLLQDDVDWAPRDRREFLQTIDEETDRLNALVGNLLDMSRLQAGAVEIRTVPVGLEEVVPAAVHSLGLADDAVDLDIPETAPAVVADRVLLERAVANVVENAVRFSPPGTRPRVTAGRVGDDVDLRVVDRGQGAPRAGRERLFEPFQRLGDSGHADGVGLGLAVAKGFVEVMGGTIEIEDTPGGGLTIVIRLRAAA